LRLDYGAAQDVGSSSTQVWPRLWTDQLTWSAQTNASWLTLDSTSGTTTLDATSGERYAWVGVRAAANLGAMRMGTITITAGGMTVTATYFQASAADVSPVVTVSPNAVSFGSGAGSAVTVTVATSGAYWHVLEDWLPSWLEVTPQWGVSGDTVTVTAKTANMDQADRIDYVDLMTPKADGGANGKRLKVTQAGAVSPDTISLTSTELSFGATNASGLAVVITTSGPSWSAQPGCSWLEFLTPTANVSGTGLSILPLPNTSTSPRTCVVTVTAGSAQATITVTQAGATPAPANRFESFTLSADLNGDGRGDILAVEATSGTLRVFSTTASGTLQTNWQAATGIGGQRVFGPGDWDGDKKADVVTVATDGTMWLRRGNGVGGLAAPTQNGRGWSAYRIVPCGDLNGDKTNDLLAIDAAGKLWLYPGNGKGGFLLGRTEVGHGWTGFDLYAAGDLNNDQKADILAVNSSGVLYAYLGKGNGQFQTPVQVGQGWGTFTLASGADLNGDGLADIVGRNDSTGVLYYYQGKGTGQFAAAKQIATDW
jgi:hypothetical protein